MILKKEINAYGKKFLLACDEKCHKAWGLNYQHQKELDSCFCDHCAQRRLIRSPQA